MRDSAGISKSRSASALTLKSSSRTFSTTSYFKIRDSTQPIRQHSAQSAVRPMPPAQCSWEAESSSNLFRRISPVRCKRGEGQVAFPSFRFCVTSHETKEKLNTCSCQTISRIARRTHDTDVDFNKLYFLPQRRTATQNCSIRKRNDEWQQTRANNLNNKDGK